MAVHVDPTIEAWRRPGCSDFCRLVPALVPGQFGRGALEQHHPESHEEYGRMMAGVDVRLTAFDLATGPLLLRRPIREAYVNGRLIDTTRIEWAILDALARRAGHLVLSPEIVARVWGVVSYSESEAHLLRISVWRLRKRLREAGRMIVSRPSQGYRLALEPYTGPLP